MKPLRAGVIGVGHLGQHHARHYATLSGLPWLASAMRRQTIAQLIADRHGVQAWTTMADLLAQVDLVSVAVPTSAHFAAAKACLDAGKHIAGREADRCDFGRGPNSVELAARAVVCCRSGIVSASTRSCSACDPISNVRPSSKAIASALSGTGHRCRCRAGSHDS